jgi:hypothetical protein
LVNVSPQTGSSGGIAFLALVTQESYIHMPLFFCRYDPRFANSSWPFGPPGGSCSRRKTISNRLNMGCEVGRKRLYERNVSLEIQHDRVAVPVATEIGDMMSKPGKPMIACRPVNLFQ